MAGLATKTDAPPKAPTNKFTFHYGWISNSCDFVHLSVTLSFTFHYGWISNLSVSVILNNIDIIYIPLWLD